VPKPVTIAVVSPGAMGSALGRVWAAAGARVIATVAGRSPRTRELAFGLELLPTLDDVLLQADLVCSVVPPGRATAVAELVAEHTHRLGVSPGYADLNAIAPSTVAEIESVLGRPPLDGAISGGPPAPGGGTTLYLAGPQPERLAALTAPGLRTVVVGSRPGLASVVKMSTASVYKGLTALLAQALQSAEHYGVTDYVVADLQPEFPDQIRQLPALLALAASKSDRFPDEMRQIAQAQGEAGAEAELFQAMAGVYEAVHRSRLARLTPEQARQPGELAAVLAALADR